MLFIAALWLREKAARVLTGICEDEVKARVFFFHHALDVLAQRLSSAIILGRSLRGYARISLKVFSATYQKWR